MSYVICSISVAAQAHKSDLIVTIQNTAQTDLVTFSK